MRYFLWALSSVAALMLQALPVHAIPMTFVANLSAANEVPPVASAGTGLATVVLDPTAETIQINATFSGLTSLTTAAHIHCCAPLGTNAGVATTVPTFPALGGFPAFPIVANGNGVTAGNYVSAVFDLTQSLIYNTTPVTGFVALQGGVPQAEAALIAGIENGQTYFNIHTQNFPGGEIRGQLFLAVPEPASLVVLGSAVFGFFLLGRRRKRMAPTAG
jgi:CHRD domain-containing protein/PEP-CTERM motif-containing protein